MRRLIGFVLLAACGSSRPPGAKVEPKSTPAAAVEVESCIGGMTSLFLRDNSTHCVWRCERGRPSGRYASTERSGVNADGRQAVTRPRSEAE